MKKFKNHQRPLRKYRFDIVGHKKALKIWWDSPFKAIWNSLKYLDLKPIRQCGSRQGRRFFFSGALNQMLSMDGVALGSIFTFHVCKMLVPIYQQHCLW